jgi:hypothetical protein
VSRFTTKTLHNNKRKIVNRLSPPSKDGSNTRTTIWFEIIDLTTIEPCTTTALQREKLPSHKGRNRRQMHPPHRHERLRRDDAEKHCIPLSHDEGMLPNSVCNCKMCDRDRCQSKSVFNDHSPAENTKHFADGYQRKGLARVNTLIAMSRTRRIVSVP